MKIPRNFKNAIDTAYQRSRYMGSDNPRAYDLLKSFLSKEFTRAAVEAPDNERKHIFKLWKNITGEDLNGRN
jgi:hypothetical protein